MVDTYSFDSKEKAALFADQLQRELEKGEYRFNIVPRPETMDGGPNHTIFVYKPKLEETDPNSLPQESDAIAKIVLQPGVEKQLLTLESDGSIKGMAVQRFVKKLALEHEALVPTSCTLQYNFNDVEASTRAFQDFSKSVLGSSLVVKQLQGGGTGHSLVAIYSSAEDAQKGRNAQATIEWNADPAHIKLESNSKRFSVSTSKWLNAAAIKQGGQLVKSEVQKS